MFMYVSIFYISSYICENGDDRYLNAHKTASTRFSYSHALWKCIGGKQDKLRELRLRNYICFTFLFVLTPCGSIV